MQIKKVSRRDYSLDIIRITAIIFVLFTHTGNMGSKIYTTLEPNGIYYIFCLSLDVIRMICVPLFLMVSGSLLLKRDESIHFLFKIRIAKMIVVLITFSFIQYILTLKNSQQNFSFHNFIYLLYTGNIRGSYWYLYLYLAYLFLLPFIRNIALLMDTKNFFYLIILSTLIDIMGLIAYDSSELYSSFYSYISLINGYAILYPLLGYGAYNYLQKKSITPLEQIIWFLIFLATVCSCSWLVYNEYTTTGSYSEAHIWRFTALLTVPVYILLYNIGKKIHIPFIGQKILELISNSCFGIYLCENFFETCTVKIYFYCYSIFNLRLFSCAIYILCTIIFGTVIITLIKKIPIIAKFL